MWLCTLDRILNVSESVLNAFVNTQGGTLYIGIGKDFVVKGVEWLKIKLTVGSDVY